LKALIASRERPEARTYDPIRSDSILRRAYDRDITVIDPILELSDEGVKPQVDVIED
jgi:hypothetical protein